MLFYLNQGQRWEHKLILENEGEAIVEEWHEGQ